MFQTDERLLSIQEVAELLNVTRGTIYRWRYQRCGPRAFKVGKHVRFKRSDVDAWLEDRADKPGTVR